MSQAPMSEGIIVVFFIVQGMKHVYSVGSMLVIICTAGWFQFWNGYPSVLIFFSICKLMPYAGCNMLLHSLGTMKSCCLIYFL